MKIRSQKDFFSGVMFTATGIAFAWGATTYNIGQGARMGPGYFPLMLGVALAFLGAIIMFTSMVVETENGDPIGRWAWKPLAYVIGANVVFGILLGGIAWIGLQPMGLMAAIYALVIIASLAGERVNFKHVAILATVLAIGSYLAFIVLLKLQMPVWPAFISG